MNHQTVGFREVFGARLRTERDRLGLNQSEMALKGSVTKNSQWAYEAGRRACDTDYLAALADAGIDVGFLLTGARAIDQLESAEVELLDGFRHLARDQQQAVIQLVGTMSGRAMPSQRIHTPSRDYLAEEPRR
ncbi:hypothetical protein BH10PSE14_BH10PSE14_04570 [soil metagenome]